MRYADSFPGEIRLNHLFKTLSHAIDKYSNCQLKSILSTFVRKGNISMGTLKGYQVFVLNGD